MILQPPTQTDDSALVAIIGMAGRFPGAADVNALWRNIRDGRETITFFSDRELADAGIDAGVLKSPAYVKARGVLTGIESFDAPFFKMSRADAELMDPQHRLFLELAWETLESAGYDPETFDGKIGVFATAALNTYFLSNLRMNPGFIELMGHRAILANDKDYIATRVSYHLNLTGPSMSVQTACSSSLVAVHLAVQSLLNGECDLVLAGGVSIGVPQIAGYLWYEGGIGSVDGHCRAFDASASGTVFGSGIGLVAMRRLPEALQDGDCVRAVIRGSAVNNDGALKSGYTAPSVQGQTAVIREALAVAGIEPDTVTYIQAHGTATLLGDPVEVAALTEAYGSSRRAKATCALGSVKTNVGHLDVAAGVVGLIATVSALEHKMLPASLHYEAPNPEIDFSATPFYVNSITKAWNRTDAPRRAGVSSFGIGGTNAHVILEEAPPPEPRQETRGWKILPLSARTPGALQRAQDNLLRHLEENPAASLADVAHTLQSGRRRFEQRWSLVCRDVKDAVDSLRAARIVGRTPAPARARPVVFVFSGQGSQYVGMGRELYETQSVFRENLDACFRIVGAHWDCDLRAVLYPDAKAAVEAAGVLDQTLLTQPAIFAIEYSLAKLWMHWGVCPGAMIGHSIGEYVAACLAGVFSLEDALVLIAARARQMQELPRGSMLAIALPEQRVRELLRKGIDLAAVNGPFQCVVSGPGDAIQGLESELEIRNVMFQRLRTSHAFHSAMMNPAVGPLARAARSIQFRTPRTPFVSTVTGTWIRDEEATDPNYWARQIRETVRFAEGMTELMCDAERIALEVGPGKFTTAALISQETVDVRALFSLPGNTRQSEAAFILGTLGKLWAAGAPIDWKAFHGDERLRRVPLPTYPFDRERYWIDCQPGVADRTDSAPIPSTSDQEPKPLPDNALPAAACRDQGAKSVAAIDRGQSGSVESIIQQLDIMSEQMDTLAKKVRNA